MVRRAILLALVLASGCAFLKRSLTVDPQAPVEDKTVTLTGFVYNGTEGRLTIQSDVADDLIVCVPAQPIHHQFRGDACTSMRDLRSYIQSLVPVAP